MKLRDLVNAPIKNWWQKRARLHGNGDGDDIIIFIVKVL